MRHAARNIASLLIGMALFAPTAWSSGSGRISVHPAGSSRFVVQPGKVLTTGLRILNNTDSSHTVNAGLRLPDGWRPVLFEPSYTLGPRTTDIRIVSVQVPAATPAGTYAVRYSVSADSVRGSEAMLVVAVSEVKMLALEMMPLPRFAVPGEPNRASAVLVNRGNKSRTVRLVAGPQPWVTVDSSLVCLAPGETRPVNLALSPPADLPLTGQVISVRAELTDDSTTRVQTSGWLKMISRTDDDEHVVRLPLTVRLRAVGQDNNTGLQLEVAGASSLTSDADHLDFLLRTPDIRRQSLLGYHDEYRASYRNGPYRVFFGDRPYALSTLTEYGRYAFGVGGEAEIGDATVGAFANKNRFYPIRQEEQAVFARYRLPSSTTVGLNYFQSLERLQGKAVTLQGTSQPHPLAAVDLEYGMGSLAGEPDNAVSMRLSGRDAWGSYELRYLRGGPHYPGYYRDMSFASGAFTLLPLEGLRLEGYLRDERRNLLKNPSLFYAPHNRYLQVGATYGEYLAVHYRGTQQKDVLPTPRYGRDENLVLIRSGISFSRLNFFGGVEFGTARDLILGTSGPYRRYTLFTGLRPFEGHTYGLSFEYTTDRNLYVNEVQRRIAGGLTAGIRLDSRTMLNMGLYGSRTTAQPAQTYTTVDGTLEHWLPWGHQVILRGRQNIYTPSADGCDRAFLIEYAMPVGIPIRRVGTIGRLSGRVVDAQTGRGLSDVLLYLGGTVTPTDDDGKFVFPAVTPDTVILLADLSARGMDLITEELMPLRLVVRGGEDTEVALNVIRSATVTGTITLFDFDDPMRPDSSTAVMLMRGGLAGAVVELSRENEVHRRVSDNKGRFSFAGLRPGRWTLSLSEDDLPEYHYFSPAVDTIHVGPGTTSDVSISVLPRRRKIRIIHDETGMVNPGDDAGKAAAPSPAPRRKTQKQGQGTEGATGTNSPQPRFINMDTRLFSFGPLTTGVPHCVSRYNRLNVQIGSHAPLFSVRFSAVSGSPRTDLHQRQSASLPGSQGCDTPDGLRRSSTTYRLPVARCHIGA